MTQESASTPHGVDLDRPNAARIYDWMLGGSHNWAIDRLFGEELVRNLPIVRSLARSNREFLGRTVKYCARQGIHQFLDLGSGVPTAGNVHEVADEVSTHTRCVYVDFEPVAAAHCRLLLEEQGDPRRHAVVEDDMTKVDQVWEKAVKTGVLDPRQPIAVLMVAVLHFVPSERGAYDVVARYRELLPAGSCLIIAHVTDDGVPEDLTPGLRRLMAQYESSSTPVVYRNHQEVGAFFCDFDLVEPGLVYLPRWRLDERFSPTSLRLADAPERVCNFGGVGRKSSA